MKVAWAGVRLAVSRLYSRDVALGALLLLGLVALGARLEVSRGLVRPEDPTLLGAVFGLAIPLGAWLLMHRACDGQQLQRAMSQVSRHGASRRNAALGLVAVVTLTTTLLGVISAGLGVLVARGWDTGVAGDVISSGGIGGLAGVAYSSWLAFASTWGARGGGRHWALLLDWLLGASTGVLALPWPRGHLRNLLGAEPILEMPQLAAGATLWGLVLLCLSLTLTRTQP